jgi:hypothetical protein
MCNFWCCRFALSEAKLALARLYRDFDFKLLLGQVPLEVGQVSMQIIDTGTLTSNCCQAMFL